MNQKQQTALTANPDTTMSKSERFTQRIISEFGGGVSAPQLTSFQRQLVEGYFIAIDRSLKTAEENRERKNKSNSDHQYDNNLPYIWQNINMDNLAMDAVHYARMGLDMMQENHLFPIPYKNNKLQKYDITMMPGYNGIAYIAEKYAVEKPLAVTIELVYSTDIFKPIKKSLENKVEGYCFEITSAFDRGELQGGFGYLQYADPAKNKLIMLSLKDILKRKPAYASAEFWGGKKTEGWGKNKKEVETDGWFEEMCLKTIKREVYSAKHIPRDPAKIDESYQFMLQRERETEALVAAADIEKQANLDAIDITPGLDFQGVNEETGEVFDGEAEREQEAAQPALEF